MATLIVCIKRRPGMTHEAFLTYWRETHAPLLAACGDFTRHLDGYVQFHPIRRTSPVATMFGVSSDYDGVAMLTFRDPDAMVAAFAEPAYLRDVQPDEPNFVDLTASMSFIADPFVVK